MLDRMRASHCACATDVQRAVTISTCTSLKWKGVIMWTLKALWGKNFTKLIFLEFVHFPKEQRIFWLWGLGLWGLSPIFAKENWQKGNMWQPFRVGGVPKVAVTLSILMQGMPRGASGHSEQCEGEASEAKAPTSLQDLSPERPWSREGNPPPKQHPNKKSLHKQFAQTRSAC